MECEKCGVAIWGGSEPTGFRFPPCSDCFSKNIPYRNLCKPCYMLFWKEFSKISENFIEEFFNGL